MNIRKDAYHRIQEECGFRKEKAEKSAGDWHSPGAFAYANTNSFLNVIIHGHALNPSKSRRTGPGGLDRQ